jgi:hypothetical protein
MGLTALEGGHWGMNVNGLRWHSGGSSGFRPGANNVSWQATQK